MQSRRAGKYAEGFGECLGEGGGGRAASGDGPEGRRAHGGAIGNGGKRREHRRGLSGSRGSKRVNRRSGGRSTCGIERAMRRRRKAGGARLGLKHPGAHGGGHDAVVCAVAAAAGGQTGIVTGSERGRERAKAEEECQEDGEYAPHSPFMVHEFASVHVSRLSGAVAQVSSMHRQTATCEQGIDEH